MRDDETLPVDGPPPTPASAMAPESVLAGRYRLVRFLARGGMGEVYEAEDRELREHVALKTIHPSRLADGRALDWFKREIFLARKVTHPNVCRIFDFGQHDKIAFLTMELLTGETLAHRIHRLGRLAPPEAQPIVEQVAAGLAAAHAVGIVHRDLKAQNIMLCGGPALRVVITDFGLARGRVHEDASLSRSGEMIGTPGYMAPEQVEGREVGPAADIYALGVVLYEMVTGALPFGGDTPMAAAIKRLREPAPSPRKLAPELDPAWEAVILRCLERDPKARFASVGEVARALGPVQKRAVLAALSTEIKPRRRLRWLAPLAALLLVGGAVGIVAWRSRRPAPSPQASSIKPRRSVAVVGFRNLTGRNDAAWLSSAFAEMLATELASGEQLRAIGGAEIARCKHELALGDADSLAPETLAKLRADVGAEVVVLGSYVALGERIRIDLRVQETAGGQTLATFSESGAEHGLFEIVTRAGTELRRRLGVEVLSPRQASSVRAAVPQNADAARAYAEGLALWRNFDFAGAQKKLEAAVAAEPAFPFAHSALAQVLSDLGYEERARQEARRALEHAGELGRQDRLLLEARSEELANHPSKAASIYAALHEFFPDDIDRGLDLSRVQTLAGHPKDALATLDELRKLPSPLGDDVRIDLWEANAARGVDGKRALAAAQRAAQRADERGAHLLWADARRTEAGALDAMGDAKAALPIYEEVMRVHEKVGNRLRIATDLLDIGVARHRLGDQRAARELFDQALAIFREMGDRAREGWALGNLGTGAYNDGDYDGAQKLWRQAAAIAHEVDNRGDELSIKSNLGVLADERGDVDGALALYEEVRAGARELGMRELEAIATLNLGESLLRKGDLLAARKAFAQSLPMRRELGDKEGESIDLAETAVAALEAGDLDAAEHAAGDALSIARPLDLAPQVAGALMVLADVARERDDAARARTQLDEAVKLLDAIPDRKGAADARLSLAELELDAGHAAAAAAQAEKLGGEFGELHVADHQARAEGVHALALAALGRTADARKAIDRAQELVAKSPNAPVELELDAAFARIAAASGQAADAATRLDRAIARAGKLGFRRRLLELRLATRAHLPAVAKDAQAAGFSRMARMR